MRFLNRRGHRKPNGLVLLLDTCESAAGAIQAVRKWSPKFNQIGFEVLSASAMKAFHLKFTKTIVKCLRDGDQDEYHDFWRCEGLNKILKKVLDTQESLHLASEPHEALFLGVNLGRLQPAWTNTKIEAEVERLTQGYVPTAMLDASLRRR